MLIRLARNEDQKAWDSYIDKQEAICPYCRFGWKEATESAYGHQGYYLLSEINGTISGIFPLILLKIPFGPKILCSLPFCDSGGLHSENHEIAYALLEKSFSLARDLRASRLEIRGGAALDFFLDKINCQHENRADKVRMLIPLPATSEELWNGFKSKLRSQINKAKNNNLSFAWGDFDSFYSVFKRNMHHLGSPVHSKKWIQQVCDRFGSNANIGVVYHKNLPIGGGIILSTARSVSVPWASTLRQYNYLAPNMLLYWNFLKYSADNEKKSFDFGRSTLNGGTYKFKQQWGAQPATLQWTTIQCSNVLMQSKFQIFPLDRHNIVSLWRKLPEALADHFGPVVRKYISL